MATLSARYLVDKSALARMPRPAVRNRLAPVLEAGEAATCGVIDLGVLYSAQSARDHEAIRHRRKLAYTRIPMLDEDFERAIEVQFELAKTAQHRVPIPDLLIAAVAERAELILLHYRADFDRIAEVTGQDARWVVPQGSID